MDMPRPGPDHAKLMRLAGRWAGDEVLAPSPWGPGGPAHGATTLSVDLDGMALVQEYEETKDGQPMFHGHGVFVIDPHGSDVLWWWFDSMGFPPDGPARGRWDGERHRTQKRKALRQVFHFVTNSKNCFGLEMMAGGSGS